MKVQLCEGHKIWLFCSMLLTYRGVGDPPNSYINMKSHSVMDGDLMKAALWSHIFNYLPFPIYNLESPKIACRWVRE